MLYLARPLAPLAYGARNDARRTRPAPVPLPSLVEAPPHPVSRIGATAVGPSMGPYARALTAASNVSC
jgi:hypothetical protein